MNNSKLTRYLCVIVILLLILNIILIVWAGVLKHRDTDNKDTVVSESVTSTQGTEPSTEPATEAPTEELTEPETSEPPVETIAESEVIEPTEPPIDEQDLENLAIIIYREAGGDACCDECRRRVADVVLNRVADDRFENTIEDVLLSPHQFGKLYKTGLVWPERASWPSEQHAVERAYRIAEEVLSGKHSNVYQKGYVWFQMTKRTDDYIVCYVCGFYFSR